ncbi:phospholipid-binding protein [Rhizobium sp. L1K21]|uniref:phospholipid-binding protein n=1 Tax=Rhizobium sp. L1K21 TaxID=2954933 RepID=UPI00209281B4|nr:phospholipid-binding protein [Rhizobium sp. L1K21]MCO6186045.1 phospholipid-binding protein [Rhizobium sp. L1K21]
MSFDWGNLKKCTSGNPNTVPNPVFKLKNVPEGTNWIYFRMKDRNVPSYNHGGGWVQYSGKDTISPGAFKYKSPCPPSGSHTYEWTASAKGKKSSFGGTIATAKASRDYP